VQADALDRLALPAGASTLDRTEWVKDPDLELSFDPMLDRIQYLAENDLTSLMVLHDILSCRLAPLQDRPAHPTWMYTGVNDIMQLKCGPGCSLDEALLAASLKALTADQFFADLVVHVVVFEPICANQAVRTTLLATMASWTMSTSLWCRGATSPVAWSFPGLVVWSAPLVVMAGAVARHAAVAASQQAAAPLAVLASLLRRARANRRVSFHISNSLQPYFI
jgi:hypothetical protein